MATVSSLHFSSSLRTRTSPSQGSRNFRNRSILCFKPSQSDSKSSFCQEQWQATRREALINIFFSSISFPSLAAEAFAETDVREDLRLYSDEENKFKISIPRDWLVGAGEANGYKSITAFFPDQTSNSNVSVVITGVGPDFTRLESFGTVDAFAETLISGLDRSWKKPPAVAAKLLNSKSANGLYYIEYTLQNPGESCRHIFSALGMASNGWYNRLYTVTGQFLEEEAEKYRPKIEKSISSFRLFREDNKVLKN